MAFVINWWVSQSTFLTELPPGQVSYPAVIIVPSAPKNLAKRVAIRQTWGKSSVSSGCPVLFLVGGSEDERLKQDLFVEFSQYGDLVIADFNDTYSNLVVKTGFMLKYLQQAGKLVSENQK